MAQGWQDRLKADRDQLAQRIEALNKFMVSADYGEMYEEDQRLLKQQAVAMQAYLNVLDLRIRRIDGAPF